MLKAEEKKQKELEAKKQSIQNSLLLMKGTSGNGEASEENIELLEKKLEDITNEIRANTQKNVEAVMTDKEDKGRQEEEANTLPRKDTVIISSIGRSSRMQQNTIKPIELKKEGQDNFQYQLEKGTWGKVSGEKVILEVGGQDEAAVYNNIIQNSDDGINRPTVDSQLKNAYAGYFNEVFEKGKAPEEDMYEYIVNIHVDSLAKAYQDVYNDIVKGYEDGTREVWTQNFDEGADYIEFRLDGKNYRFHKLTMEEELEQLNNAYDETAKDVELRANTMIDQEKMLAKIMPEYEAKKKDIEAQLARREELKLRKVQKCFWRELRIR